MESKRSQNGARTEPKPASKKIPENDAWDCSWVDSNGSVFRPKPEKPGKKRHQKIIKKSMPKKSGKSCEKGPQTELKVDKKTWKNDAETRYRKRTGKSLKINVLQELERCKIIKIHWF